MADIQELITDLVIRDNLTVGLNKATAAVGQFGNTAELQAAKASASFDKFAASAVNTAKALIGITGAIGVAKFFGDAIQASVDLEASNSRLSASLKANIPAWDGNTAAIERQIKVAGQLGFTDTEVQQSIAFLVGATHDVTQALTVQNVAMDLSRFKGIDLQSATEALVKVEAGRYRLLQSLGINLKANATTTEALAAVEAVAGGQAAAFGDTTAGAMAKAAESFHVAEEALGKGLTPVVVALAGFSKDDLAPALTILGDNMDKILPVAEALALVVGGKLVVGLAASGIALLKTAADTVVLTAAEAEFAISANAAGTAAGVEAGEIVGLGTAASTTAPQLAGLGAAAGAAASGGVAALVRSLGQLAVLGSPVALATQATEAQFGKIGSPERTAAIAAAFKAAEGAASDLTGVTHGLSQATDESARAALNAAFAAGEDDRYLAALKATVLDVTPAIDAATTAMLGAGIGTGGGTDTLSDSLLRVANAATIAKNALDALPGVPFTGPPSTRDPLSGDILPPGGDSAGDSFLKRQQIALQNARDLQARLDKEAADGLAAAKTAADAYAQTLNEKLGAALSTAKDRDTSLFDALHQRHLQAINDVETLAQKQHDANTQAISDALKLQLSRDAAPVNAAEAAQNAIEISRQNRDLNAAVKSAQTGGDPLAIRQAQEALESFEAAQHINFLKGQQAEHDLAAQASAAAKQQTADDALSAAKLAQATAITAETARSKKQTDDFNRALDALKIADKGKTPGEVQADITKLDKKFGITTDPTGIGHIVDVLSIAIKTIKVPPTVVHVGPIVVNVAGATLNGRLVAAALSSSMSPTAAIGVRNGGLRPF